MTDKFSLFENVRETVRAYRRFLKDTGKEQIKGWEDIPVCNKQNYLLRYPLEELYREGSLDRCFLIGASSGFSSEGTVLWLKKAEDEEVYLQAVKDLLIRDYAIHEKRTLIIVSLAFGTWIGGMQIACTFRKLAGDMDGVTVATPGIDLKESVYIATRLGKLFEQILWVVNPSSISIIYANLLNSPELLKGKIYFPVVGEYFTESFRESFARKFGHEADNPFVVKTGYGSADTGDLGIERVETIRLRKFLERNHDLAEKIFGEPAAPMLFKKNPKAFIETIHGNIVVTKNQFIPLIRYDTKDRGGIVRKSFLRQAGVDEDFLEELPDEILYVFGRVEDAIVFYGTNLDVAHVSDFLTSLNESYAYGGLFEIEPKEKKGVELFEFTIYVDEARKGLEIRYRHALIDFLKASSNEFAAKYDKLANAVGGDLIDVRLRDIHTKQIDKKHRVVKKGR